MITSTTREPLRTLLLPFVFALVTIRASVMPWVTVRSFSGENHYYNLADIRGGVGIILTICLVILIGVVVAIFFRSSGLTIMSIGTATIGWMAAISGVLLSLVGSVIPSISVAGLDLARASVGQGVGVIVAVMSSFSLAFAAIRRLDPIKKYVSTRSIPALPLLALVFLVVVASSMHSEWLRLATADAEFQAILSGDSLYGSGLVVLALWLGIGCWIGSLVIQRPVSQVLASVISLLVAGVVLLYSILLWVGGKALDLLIPANVSNWTTFSIEPALYLIFISSVLLVMTSLGGLIRAVQRLSIPLGKDLAPGSARVRPGELLAGVLLVLLIASFVVW